MKIRFEKEFKESLRHMDEKDGNTKDMYKYNNEVFN
jgi:hypothetical protein